MVMITLMMKVMVKMAMVIVMMVVMVKTATLSVAVMLMSRGSTVVLIFFVCLLDSPFSHPSFLRFPASLFIGLLLFYHMLSFCSRIPSLCSRDLWSFVFLTCPLFLLFSPFSLVLMLFLRSSLFALLLLWSCFLSRLSFFPFFFCHLSLVSWLLSYIRCMSFVFHRGPKLPAQK